MHRRKWESRSPEPFALVILHWERANKVFGKRFVRLLKKNLHHGLSFVQVRRCSESLSATSSVALRSQDNLRPVNVVRLPEEKISISVLLFYSVLIMFFEIMIILCLITSMIELFMLDLIMFMIYLF